MCQVIIVTFDLTKIVTLENSANWCKSVRKLTKNAPWIVLVGSKADECVARSVSKDYAEDFAKKNELAYFEISVKLSQGVKELREKISNHVLSKNIKEGEHTNKESRACGQV